MNHPLTHGHRPCAGARARPLGGLALALGLLPGLSRAGIADVQPFYGSGGIGYGVGALNPGPSLPHGMAKPGPDTSLRGLYPGWAHCGGYWYPDPEIRGFSQTHPSGIGVADYGNLAVMPVMNLSAQMLQDDNYRSSFSHESEEAAVGYYAVTLDRTSIRTEISAARRAAYYRFTYPGSASSQLLLDAAYGVAGSTTYDASVTLYEDGSFEGWQHYGGGMSDRFGGYVLYFYGELSIPPDAWGTFTDDVPDPGSEQADGPNVGGFWTWVTAPGQTIDLKMGLSYISTEQARANLEQDIPGWGLEEVRARAEQEWEEALSVAQVEGGSATERQIFYSALYRTLGMPTNFTEVGDVYLGFDKQVHPTEGYAFMSDLSLWDTYRTLHPLYNLLYPEAQRDSLMSLLRMWEQSGNVPRWPLAQGETGSMIGEPADIVFADAWLKGVRDFDTELAWEALGERDNWDDWIAQVGYFPAEAGGSSVSKHLEYTLADYAMGVLANAWGHSDDAAFYRARSATYANLFNPRTGFFQARSQDGSWEEPFWPHWFHESYAEGNAWQLLWFVPHDPYGLIDLLGGERAFLDALSTFFERSSRQPDTLLPDTNYWHGNEPDIQAAWLFNYIGRPDLTAKWVRWILSTKYTAGPDGLDGNDDGGTLSAWYVFASTGLFPVPAQDVYLLGSPLFSSVRLELPGGALTVKATGTSAQNLYVQSATLNGAPLTRAWLRHDEIAGGGELTFVMGASPSAWGTLPEDLPPGGL